jgi:hypothetical protein
MKDQHSNDQIKIMDIPVTTVLKWFATTVPWFFALVSTHRELFSGSLTYNRSLSLWPPFLATSGADKPLTLFTIPTHNIQDIWYSLDCGKEISLGS